MIYIVRHGKTSWNKEKIIAEKSDILLSDDGITIGINVKFF